MKNGTGIRMSSRRSWHIAIASSAFGALSILGLGCNGKSVAEEPRPSVHAAPPVLESAVATPDPQKERAATLILGTIGDNPQEEKDKLTEWPLFFDYMVKHLSTFGITNAKLVQCHNPAEMAAWMRDGKVDLFDESPFAAYIEHRIGDADEPIANRWKNYNEKFGSVIFTRRQSSVRSLDDLRGKMIAFRGDTSTTQYFLQKVFLTQKGYNVVEKQAPTDPVGRNEIGYYFAWSSRDKVVEDVVDGVAAAGGNSDEFIDKLLGHDGKEGGRARHPRPGVPQAQKEDLRILARIPGVLRRLVTARKTLDPKLKVAIKDLLVNMHNSAEGKAVLESCGPAAKFTPLDSDAAAYEGIANQGPLIENEVKKFAAVKY